MFSFSNDELAGWLDAPLRSRVATRAALPAWLASSNAKITPQNIMLRTLGFFAIYTVIVNKNPYVKGWGVWTGYGRAYTLTRMLIKIVITIIPNFHHFVIHF
jgi:hypothetical protein